MIVYSLLTVNALLVLLCFHLLWSSRGQYTARWHRVMLACILAVFLYLYGTWVFLSVYLKYIFAVVFLSLSIIGISRKRGEAAFAGIWRYAVNLLCSAMFFLLIILYYTGTTGKPYGVADLSFPFRNGTYFVFQGGKGLPTNMFHYELRGAVYAMDIVKLNDAGNRATRIFSTRLDDYEIFNDTIYSPCSGTVLKTEDGNPDNIPPNRKRGPTNTNQVLLATDKYYIFMGHLKQGCVFVHAGDSAYSGHHLGCVGNSSFSLEPHLHLQVHARSGADIPWYKEKPMLIAFEGKSYLLFEEIKARYR